MIPVTERRTGGFWMLGVVVLAITVAFCFVMVWARTSTETLADVSRIREAQQTMEIARSALGETISCLQRAANDPSDPLFRVLRQGPLAASFRLPLPWPVYTGDLTGAEQFTIVPECEVVQYLRVSPWPLDAIGQLRLSVTVTSPRRTVRGLTERRAFRIQRIVFPPPLNRWVLGPPATASFQVFGAPPGPEGVINYPLDRLVETEEGLKTYETLSLPTFWKRGVVAFEVDAAGGERALQSWLERATAARGRVNGVVMIDNQGLGPQKLTHLTFRGKALIVVTGPCELEEVTLGNRAEDLLSVVSYGKVAASGRLDLNLLRLLHPSQVGSGIDLSTGRVVLFGSLLDITGIEAQPFFGSLTANPLSGAGTPGPLLDPRHLVVLISPLVTVGPTTRE